MHPPDCERCRAPIDAEIDVACFTHDGVLCAACRERDEGIGRRFFEGLATAVLGGTVVWCLLGLLLWGVTR